MKYVSGHETATKLIRVKPSTAEILHRICMIYGCSFDFALNKVLDAGKLKKIEDEMEDQIQEPLEVIN